MKRFSVAQSIIVLLVCVNYTLIAQTWTLPASGIFGNVQSGVVFLDANNAIVVGGYTQPRVRKTTDGGATWTTPYSSTSYYRLNAVCFTNTTNGYAVGDVGTLLHTTNAGDTWSFQSNPVAAAYQYLYGVSFFDANHGIAVGAAGSIIWTSDGSTWNTPSTNPGIYLNAVCFYSATNAIAVGSGGAIVKTTNGGVDWTSISAVNGNSLTAVKFFNGNTGIAVGATGTILRTTDGGDSWAEISAPATDAYRAISFYNISNGVISGDGPRLAKTTDGGLTWTNMATAAFSASTYLPGVSFIDKDKGIVLGSDNSSGFIYSTADAGLPVELTSFTAMEKNGEIILKWQTASEINNYGFRIERRDGNVEWSTIGFAEGHGTANSLHEYSFTDNQRSSNGCSYRLKQIDRNGAFKYSHEVDVINGSSPAKFELMQNFPNPFNPSTAIKFQVPSAGNVTVRVYDNIGRVVDVPVDRMMEAGYHTTAFNGTSLSSGIYIVRLSFGGRSLIQKIVLMK